MDLTEIERIVHETTEDNWARVDVVQFGTEFNVSQTRDEFNELEANAHHSLAVYREDVSLALAWGLVQNEGRAWEGIWVQWVTFSDPTVYGRYADVLWCGVPVIRALGVSVDGGRAILPAPSVMESDHEGTPNVEGWKVTTFEDALFRLVDSIFSHGDYDNYLQRAGFQLQD